MPFPQNRYMAGSGGPISFLLREIITTGYLLSGYKDTAVWRNVNRMQHSTDTAVNLGDLLPAGGAYSGGMCGSTFSYITRASGSWLPNVNTVNKINMVTEVGSSANAMPFSTSQNGQGAQNEKLRAYLPATGASSSLMRFDFASESWMSSIGLGTINFNQAGHASVFTELYGWIWGDDNNSTRITYATETQQASSVSGAHDQQHGQSSKVGRGYAGGDGSYNGGYVLRRWNLVTETNVGNITKPVPNCGEENYDMGQAHSYMMGCYDGAQNNKSYRMNYATDSGFAGGSTMEPKGVPGRSSGICGWRA